LNNVFRFITKTSLVPSVHMFGVIVVGALRNNSSWRGKPATFDFKSGAVTTRPRCLL